MTGAYAKQPPTKIMDHDGACAVEECDRPYYALHYCRLHWERVRRSGTTETSRVAPGTAIADRLAMRSERVGDCIEYTGYRDRDGYGDMKVGGAMHRAHRLAYEVAYGPLPNGIVVRHKCDNPPCINPAHLEAGSNADNQRDKVERGRSTFGAKNPSSKLTANEVREIRSLRESGWTYELLAARFHVGTSTIGRIVKRTHWRHVT